MIKALYRPDSILEYVKNKASKPFCSSHKINAITSCISARIERLFSNWSYIHSSIRNRLTFERSKKLLHIYFSLKITDKNESDDY